MEVFGNQKLVSDNTTRFKSNPREVTYSRFGIILKLVGL